MIRLIFSDLWQEFRRKWAACLMWWIVLFVCVSLTGNWYIAGTEAFAGNGIKNLSEEELERFGEFLTCIISGAGLLLIWGILRLFPLRLNKGLFVCATDERERLFYMKIQLAAKMGLGLILYLSFCGAAYKTPGMVSLTHWFLVGCMLFVCCLGSGLREDAVFISWTLALLAAGISFYVCVLYRALFNPLGAAVCLVFILSNLCLAFRYAGRTLRNAASYEYTEYTEQGRKRNCI